MTNTDLGKLHPQNLIRFSKEDQLQYPSLLFSLSDSGGENAQDTGEGSRLADSSIRLSMKSLTWLSN